MTQSAQPIPVTPATRGKQLSLALKLVLKAFTPARAPRTTTPAVPGTSAKAFLFILVPVAALAAAALVVLAGSGIEHTRSERTSVGPATTFKVDIKPPAHKG